MLPSSIDELVKLPGIGRTTASEIAAFAFNQPTVFIETNIRSVFIHFFFHNQNNISDAEILPLVEKTLDKADPRTWYYALMDYGTSLKKMYPNPNRKSLHYRSQSPFQGSDRQIRGMILKILASRRKSCEEEMVRGLKVPTARARANLEKLEQEGLIIRKDNQVSIAQ
jgi:A/G-specific adenine glycosylase